MPRNFFKIKKMKEYANLMSPTKYELNERFGHIFFQIPLANIDIFGLELKKTKEIIVVLFRGGSKIGYYYDGKSLAPEQVFRVFCDCPNNIDSLEQWEKNLNGRIEVLHPPKISHFWVSDREVVETNRYKLIHKYKKTKE